MVETFKIPGTDPDDMFKRATKDGTQSNGAKLWQGRSRLNANATPLWNNFSSEVVSAEGVNASQKLLDKRGHYLLLRLCSKDARC